MLELMLQIFPRGQIYWVIKGHLESYCIYLCKGFVLTCLRMASVHTHKFKKLN